LSNKVFLLEPKWIASMYALVASVVCILVFTYSDMDFFQALTKTFFTVVAFYLLGIATASLVNFIMLNFSKKDEADTELVQQDLEQPEESGMDSEEAQQQA
jgi:uncharacterized membrane protein YgaE (UPF0421/DUF939 family)